MEGLTLRSDSTISAYLSRKLGVLLTALCGAELTLVTAFFDLPEPFLAETCLVIRSIPMRPGVLWEERVDPTSC